jgi:hypothetical protein
MIVNGKNKADVLLRKERRTFEVVIARIIEWLALAVGHDNREFNADCSVGVA